MKEHPIIFSTPMVQAILEGRKTMTRRVVKGLPEGTHAVWFDGGEWIVENDLGQCWVNGKLKCPFGEPGDRLWVRELWSDCITVTDGKRLPSPQFVYKASDDFMDDDHYFKFKTPIHMPKAAARLWLEIVNIKVEKLEDISLQDAAKEGVECDATTGLWKDYHTNKFKCQSARHSFASLWYEINGLKKMMKTPNPWVWVIEFRRVEK
jgi:hypothetical protein